MEEIPSFTLMTVLLVSTLVPAFAEVTNFELDNTFYTKGSQILFSGTVDEESKGIVTIVIRDSNAEFVLLTQALIQPDSTFQRSIDTDKKFEDHGIHNATAFIIDLAKGKTTSFDFSLDGSLPIPSITSIQTTPDIQVEPVEDNTSESNSKTNVTPESTIVNNQSRLANFVDPTKDPQHYLDRYYNEQAYKDWFDKNYPGITIEEAVGIKVEPEPNTTETPDGGIGSILEDEVIPEAGAVAIINTPFKNGDSDDNEITLLGLALGGLAVLFGAIYGIKRKVDINSENISHNRVSIRKKMFGSLLWNNPEDVIKNRLAHGEISVKEYTSLKNALQE